jgi:DNA-binding transcriptional regulator LsrR (DeoR family)
VSEVVSAVLEVVLETASTVAVVVSETASTFAEVVSATASTVLEVVPATATIGSVSSSVAHACSGDHPNIATVTTAQMTEKRCARVDFIIAVLQIARQ